MFEISAIVVAVGITVLASLLSPEGKTKKWVNFVLGLVAFSALALPLLSLEELSFSPPSFENTATAAADPYDMLLGMSEQELEKMLSVAFAIERPEVSLSGDGEKIAKVTVQNTEKAKEISLYLKNLLGEEWEVTVDAR